MRWPERDVCRTSGIQNSTFSGLPGVKAFAIVAAIFGFGVAAATFAGIAKILFFLFLVAFVLSPIFRVERPV